MFKNTEKRKGFTLIEMLITVSIMLIVTGGSIAGFITFNDGQKVQVVSKQLQTMFRSAQIKAKTGEGASGNGTSDGCASGTSLSAYEVKNSGDSKVIVQRVCVDSSSIETLFQRDSYDLPSGVTISNFDVRFLPLVGGTSIILPSSSPYEITISGLSTNDTLVITDSGKLIIQ